VFYFHFLYISYFKGKVVAFCQIAPPFFSFICKLSSKKKMSVIGFAVWLQHQVVHINKEVFFCFDSRNRFIFLFASFILSIARDSGLA